jgi:hypothetical protein
MSPQPIAKEVAMSTDITNNLPRVVADHIDAPRHQRLDGDIRARRNAQ